MTSLAICISGKFFEQFIHELNQMNRIYCLKKSETDCILTQSSNIFQIWWRIVTDRFYLKLCQLSLPIFIFVMFKFASAMATKLERIVAYFTYFIILFILVFIYFIYLNLVIIDDVTMSWIWHVTLHQISTIKKFDHSL